MRIGAAREMEIRRLDFGRGEGIHGEWRKVDWTVDRCLSQWAQYGSFKRFDQPETPLAHRINDFWPASGARANVKARLLIRWRVIWSRFIRETVRRTAPKQRRRGKNDGIMWKTPAPDPLLLPSFRSVPVRQVYGNDPEVYYAVPTWSSLFPSKRKEENRFFQVRQLDTLI